MIFLYCAFTASFSLISFIFLSLRFFLDGFHVWKCTVGNNSSQFPIKFSVMVLILFEKNWFLKWFDLFFIGFYKRCHVGSSLAQQLGKISQRSKWLFHQILNDLYHSSRSQLSNTLFGFIARIKRKRLYRSIILTRLMLWFLLRRTWGLRSQHSD